MNILRQIRANLAERIELLKELSEAHGTSGSEQEVRAIFRRELSGENYRLSQDNNGSIICEMSGKTPGINIMLEAHMDEVGFMVQSITQDSYLKIMNIGGWWSHTLLSQRVSIMTEEGKKIPGIVGCKPPHFLSESERKKVVPIQDMYIDIGANSSEEITEKFGIRVGDPIVPESAFRSLPDTTCVLGKAFDNRVGVALAIHATRLLANSSFPGTLYTVGTVQEEVGLRGAQTAVNLVKPDIAIILEGTPADDFPGSRKDTQQAIVGGGPQIRLMDPSALMNRPLSNHILRIAREKNIPHQVAVRRSGGTNARPIQLHGSGVRVAVVGVPVRYIHTPNSLLDVEDYVHTLDLIVQSISSMDRSCEQ